MDTQLINEVKQLLKRQRKDSITIDITNVRSC